MDIFYRLQGIEFEWDDNKAKANVAKQGVTFEEAAEAFFDPFYREGDASIDEDQRDFIMGYSLSQRLLLVVHTQRGESGRASFLLVLLLVLKGNYMKEAKEKFELHFRSRAIEKVSIDIPKDALDSLKKVASIRDMSFQALIKFYIGQGLRQDLSRLFADRVLDTTAEVLAKHIHSEEQVSAIIREIREARAQSIGKHEVAV
jgi:uncharacterized DUF497 family protein